jgi:hypothetical protein
MDPQQELRKEYLLNQMNQKGVDNIHTENEVGYNTYSMNNKPKIPMSYYFSQDGHPQQNMNMNMNNMNMNMNRNQFYQQAEYYGNIIPNKKVDGEKQSRFGFSGSNSVNPNQQQFNNHPQLEHNSSESVYSSNLYGGMVIQILYYLIRVRST